MRQLQPIRRAYGRAPAAHEVRFQGIGFVLYTDPLLWESAPFIINMLYYIT